MPLTPLLTIAWYTAGGLTAALVTGLLDASDGTGAEHRDESAA